jgi:hypothetical protein
LGEKNRLRVSENRVLKKIFKTKRKTIHGENCTMMNFTACILHRILLGRLNQEGRGGGGTCGTQGDGKVGYRVFGRETRREETTGKI